MKKYLIISLLTILLLNSQIHAQLQGGNVLLGGNIANFNLGLKKGSAYNINFSPKAAWFLNDNVAVGAYINFGISGAKNSPTYTTYGIGPLARFYLSNSAVNLLKHGRWFFEGNVGIGGSNISDGGNSTNGLDLGIGPGYAYFITPNVGLETLLKYTGQVGFGNTTSTSNLALSLGLQVYLPARGTRDRIQRSEK